MRGPDPRGAGAEPQSLLDRFATFYSTRGHLERKRGGLLVSYFRTEFNRCTDHAYLNQLVRSGLPAGLAESWHQVALACRLNDMRRVEFGWHSTVFEMLVSGRVWPLSSAIQARRSLSEDTLAFLVGEVGLDPARLAVTFFGGGEIAPGVAQPPDEEWHNAWGLLGIHELNLLPVCGPKNFLMFVGPGERCGPRCEVLYRVDSGTRAGWIEVATLILDAYRLRQGQQGVWEVESAACAVAGVAYGHERLAAVSEGCETLWHRREVRSLVEIVERRANLRAEVLSLLRSDVFVLLDQVRSCLLLLAEAPPAEESPQNRAVSVMLGRIRRKIASLGITDWAWLVDEMDAEVCRRYGRRYPALWSNCGALRALLQAIRWPEGWNPESYVPVSNE